MNYRESITGAITAWDTNGLFRKKSAESVAAVKAMRAAMSSPIVRTSTGYVFLDVNEGCARFPAAGLSKFLTPYIDDKSRGLATEYRKFLMGYWQ